VSLHAWLLDGFLALTVFFSWVGCIRMRDAYQSLHYLALPGIGAICALTIAVFLQVGNNIAAWKCVIIVVILVASNSVGTHAAARAFRARQKGHWEPWPSDEEIKFLGEKPRS
jgi:monovalent cation/proton antiporter MnhG/PhaG subunit